MATITQPDIAAALADLGLLPGSAVLVHSSLSSFGHVDGGADTVIDALLAAVGAGGTVLVPTLTGSEALAPDNPPYFDPLTTPCWTGRIPETFRQRPTAIRSLHPTHSVAAIGADGHLDSLSPCDESSPYGRLAAHPQGYVLLIGVTHESNTTMHHIEELAGADYHLQPEPVAAQIVVDGRTITRHMLLHAYGTRRHFSVLEPLLRERGIQRDGRVGEAPLRLIAAGPLVELGLRALRGSRRLLCQNN
jgi:aminoglycoside 3-N-acetyltransferase